MGRGLSELQQTILQLALERRDHMAAIGRLNHELRGGDVYSQDVLVRHYGWPITYGRIDNGSRALYQGQAHHFAPTVIGPERYASDRTAVARALRRLQNRGLLCRERDYPSQRYRLRLTPAGIDAARLLSVHKQPKHTNCEPIGNSA
jgi:hypothetical protein